MSFASMNLHPLLMKGLTACGYKNPTPVQAQAIPQIILKKDIVASAQTGTGKTAAFVLPALNHLAETKCSHPRVLILTPTRELAMQIQKATVTYSKFMRANVVSLVGGMSYKQQIKDLSRPVDIVVATPGRLLDHMKNRRINLSKIEMFVLDEADRMLDMGFIDDVKDISKALPASRQSLLFSATVDNRLNKIIQQLLKNPVWIDLSTEKLAPPKIKQKAYLSDNLQHKIQLLQHFLANDNIYKGIIFSATKINADALAKQLRDADIKALALHGDLKQTLRIKTVERLRLGKVQFIVATDVAARGIDINDVTHIINFDLPKFAEDYVHRIGRTGRAGKEGVAISFVMPNDSRHLQKIERYIGEKLEMCTIEGLEPKKFNNKKSSAPKKFNHNKKSKPKNDSSHPSSKKPKKRFKNDFKHQSKNKPKRRFAKNQ